MHNMSNKLVKRIILIAQSYHDKISHLTGKTLFHLQEYSICNKENTFCRRRCTVFKDSELNYQFPKNWKLVFNGEIDYILCKLHDHVWCQKWCQLWSWRQKRPFLTFRISESWSLTSHQHRFMMNDRTKNTY